MYLPILDIFKCLKKNMHKSVIIGLLFLTAGLFGVATLNNIISHAMAQEYDKYGDSSYSTYPTDDKKYECRTGPFEGFFVSSVEFCKFNKVDDKDRKDHRDSKIGPQGPQGPPGANGTTGATGATGPQGIQGIQGIQGPIGPNGTQGPIGPNGTQGPIGPNGTQGPIGPNGTQGPIGPAGTSFEDLPQYRESRSNETTNPNIFINVKATCDPEDFLLNGGFSFSGMTGDILTIRSQQFPEGGNTWFVEARNLASDDVLNTPTRISSFAICLDNPPLR